KKKRPFSGHQQPRRKPSGPPFPKQPARSTYRRPNTNTNGTGPSFRPAPGPSRDDMAPPSANAVPSQGVLEMHPRGYGFLRDPTRNYATQPADPYVPAGLIAKHSLREGVL